MADDRYDQLYEIRQQAAHQRYVQGLQNQAQANLHDYQQAIAENDMNAAAWAESEYRKNLRELHEMTGGQAAQPQQTQQQAPQQYFTEVELGILREHPGIASDPKKAAEARNIADTLVIKHVHDAAARGDTPDANYRNSPEYDSALRIGLGLRAPDGIRDGDQILSPETVVEICKISPQQYNEGAAKLAELKRQGFYRVE
jgi:hypothetical protein